MWLIVVMDDDDSISAEGEVFQPSPHLYPYLVATRYGPREANFYFLVAQGEKPVAS
jgi:hypothetical protein